MMFRADSEVYFSMTTGDYEPGVTRLFDRLIESGMVVVDVGAHIGYYTLLAAKKVGPTGKVYAFEPAPSNYALLVKNIALNGYQNIVPVPKAVSNTQGTITFFLHPDSVTHSLHRETLGRGKTAITVETTTLDHFFEEQGWPAVHLVKMDIEGAELAALEGMTKLIERNRVCLILEFVPQILRNAGVNPSELLEKLSGLGFTIQLITKDGLQPLSDKASQNRNLHAELFCEKLRT
jgi:FkbM family methyltransferase